MSTKPIKKIVIDTDTCIGCNTCPLLDPDHFELDPATYKAKIKKQPQTEDEEETVKNTINSCPVSAISLK